MADEVRAAGDAHIPPLEECHHCGAYVPIGQYCGHCGAHLADEASSGRTRVHAYSASPREHVGQVAIISTLFPHLPHRAAHTFRVALGVGLAMILALAACRLYTSATIAAAVLLPILYLLYLYEVQVWEHEPIPVLLSTFVAGGALGTAYALVVDHFNSLSLEGHGQGLLVEGLLLPVVAEVLMLAGPLLLLTRNHFDDTLDGLTFGAASALGFSMAVAIAGNWHLLTGNLLGNAPSGDEFLRLFRLGIAVAVVNATSVGVITAALWLRHHGRSRQRHVRAWRGEVAGALLAFGMQIGLAIGDHFIVDLAVLVAVWSLAAVALILFLRVVLHHALLEEGAEHAVGPPTACVECHRLVPAMLFCPSCGVARSASPKGGRAIVAPEAPDAAPGPAHAAGSA